MTGVAVKVTELPVQIFVPRSATTVTEGTAVGVTETCAEEEVLVEQTPLCTMARKYEVVVRLAVTSGFAEETRLDQVELFNDDCQFTMLPV